MPFLLPSPHRLLCPGSMPGCFNVPTRRYSNGRVFVYCSCAVSPFVKQADAQRTSVAPMVKATPSAAVRGRPSSRDALPDDAETDFVQQGAEIGRASGQGRGRQYV